MRGPFPKGAHLSDPQDCILATRPGKPFPSLSLEVAAPGQEGGSCETRPRRGKCVPSKTQNTTKAVSRGPETPRMFQGTGRPRSSIQGSPRREVWGGVQGAWPVWEDRRGRRHKWVGGQEMGGRGPAQRPVLLTAVRPVPVCSVLRKHFRAKQRGPPPTAPPPHCCRDKGAAWLCFWLWGCRSLRGRPQPPAPQPAFCSQSLRPIVILVEREERGVSVRAKQRSFQEDGSGGLVRSEA